MLVFLLSESPDSLDSEESPISPESPDSLYSSDSPKSADSPNSPKSSVSQESPVSPESPVSQDSQDLPELLVSPEIFQSFVRQNILLHYNATQNVSVSFTAFAFNNYSTALVNV